MCSGAPSVVRDVLGSTAHSIKISGLSPTRNCDLDPVPRSMGPEHAPPAQPIRSKRIWQKEIGGGSTQSSGRIRRGPRAREEIAESWLTRQAIDARLMVDQEAKWENAT